MFKLQLDICAQAFWRLPNNKKMHVTLDPFFIAVMHYCNFCFVD
jgi:hypothetical protein